MRLPQKIPDQVEDRPLKPECRHDESMAINSCVIFLLGEYHAAIM